MPEVPAATVPELSLLAINLTRRCNLECAQCYLDAGILHRGDDDELTAAEITALLDDIAALGHGTLIVLTGGEPLLRRDLEAIVRHGVSVGLPIVIGTNAMMLTERRLQSLVEAGVLGFGISVDSLDPARHDRFRGRPGAWSRTLAGIERCRRQGLDFQLHFAVTDDNADELPAMMEFAQNCGARALNVFFTVCIGRAHSLAAITVDRYERLLTDLVQAQTDHPDLVVRPRCAPHFKRIAHQLRPGARINRISGRESDGCIAGIHYARVNHRGGVTACPYIEHEVGNIRESAFSELWANASDFLRLREPHLQGKCGACEYRLICGGCRARPQASGAGLMGADDICGYQPRGRELVEPAPGLAQHAPGWSEDAQLRLSRVPVFLRTMVKKRAEAYVTQLGENRVTCKHLSDLTAARFGADGPRRFITAPTPGPSGQKP